MSQVTKSSITPQARTNRSSLINSITDFIKPNVMKKLFILIFALFTQISNSQLNEGYTSSLVENGFFKPTQMLLQGSYQIVAEKEGNIYIMDNFVKRTNPIITEEPHIISESGLLSIVTDGTYLWDYVSLPGTPRYGAVKRYLLDVSNNTATLEEEVFNNFIQSGSNHQGGMLFLHDGYLYLSLGDSGSRWSAQKDSETRGKILRFHPFTGEGHPDNPLYDANNPKSPQSLQYSKGFRNPWRPVMHNGKLYVATVGEGDEETMYVIDQAGKNGRWPFYEGWHDTEYTVPQNPDTGQPYILENEVEPLFSYYQPHYENYGFRTSETETIDYNFNGVSIIGLGILEGLGHDGDLMFTDFFSNRLMIAKLENNQLQGFTDIGIHNFGGISSMVQDGNTLYFTSYTSGIIYKIEYETLSVPKHDFKYNLATVYYTDITGRKININHAANGLYFAFYEYEGQTVVRKEIVSNGEILNKPF